MSTTDDAPLDALDRRGRAAARSLLDDLAARGADTLVVDDTDPADGPRPSHPRSAEPAPIPATELPAPAESAVIDLGRPAGRGSGLPARRTFLAAAAVVLFAAVGGAVAVVTDDGDPDVTSEGELDYLLPGWLPGGFEPLSATGVPDTAAFGLDADVAVYGDPDSDDPWSAGLAVVHLAADEDLLGDSRSDGEAVTVAGHDARLREAESEGFGGRRPAGPGWEVEWDVDDGRMIVVGALPADEVLAAAEAATTEPAIDTSGLPDGYSELARGPMEEPSLLYTSLFEEFVDDAADGSGLAVTYADPSDSETVRPAIVVAQRRGPASAVDLLRMSFDDGDVTTVRGRHAVIGRGSEPRGSAGESGVVAVQWAEPEGQLVTVVGFGVDEDAVLQVAEGLRPARAGEVAELRDQEAVAAPREFGEARAGHVVVASGETPTGRWRLVADTDRRANIGALTVERMSGAIASTASNTGDRVEPPLDLGADTSDGTIVIWGVLWVDAASVSVEGPGGEPIELDIHEVEGWSDPVVAGAFPIDHFTGSGEGVAIVARDADGEEVARNTTVLGG
jgi:hypothetical protein